MVKLCIIYSKTTLANFTVLGWPYFCKKVKLEILIPDSISVPPKHNERKKEVNANTKKQIEQKKDEFSFHKFSTTKCILR